MIALDTNTMVALLVSSQPEHADAVAWLGTYEGPLCTTPVNVGELLRLLTHPRVFLRPLTMWAAVELFDEFVADLSLEILEEAPAWWRELKPLEKEVVSLRGNEVFDARIALCLRHNRVARICTRDGGFSRFSFLQPLVF